MDSISRHESIQLLINQLKEKRDNLNGLFHYPTNNKVMSDDISAAAAEEQDTFIASQLSRKNAKAIQIIDIALDLAKDGKYGICIDCNNEILLERLENLPSAIRCIKCQSKRENRL